MGQGEVRKSQTHGNQLKQQRQDDRQDEAEHEDQRQSTQCLA